MLSKAPEVTLHFWIIKILATTVGETVAGFLNTHFNLGLTGTTMVMSAMFALALAGTFAAWFASEKTLSIHSILTSRREGFYWLAILFRFVLGTAAGDLTAERFYLGYPQSALMFAGVIAIVAIAHMRFRAHAVLTFWIAYIVTRPLGASPGR